MTVQFGEFTLCDDHAREAKRRLEEQRAMGYTLEQIIMTGTEWVSGENALKRCTRIIRDIDAWTP
jgi:hypothetical protein